MTAAAAAASPAGTDAGAPVKLRSRKKLVLFIAIGLIALLVAGGATLVVMKMRAARAALLGDATAPLAEGGHAARPDPDHPPVFLPLDPFVVNLADTDADRYAQIGLTFEVADAGFADRLKAYMPAIRNTVLLILAQKTSADLLDRPGKERLAVQIQIEAARTMGIEVAAPAVHTAAAQAGHGEPGAPKAAVARKPAVTPNPIRRVLFSNFIIQ